MSGIAGHLNANSWELHTQNLSTTLLICLYWDDFDTSGLYIWWDMLLFRNSKMMRKKNWDKNSGQILIAFHGSVLHIKSMKCLLKTHSKWQINSPITSAMFSTQAYAAKWLDTYSLFYAYHFKESMSDVS